jgi:hypothetical protein
VGAHRDFYPPDRVTLAQASFKSWSRATKSAMRAERPYNERRGLCRANGNPLPLLRHGTLLPRSVMKWKPVAASGAIAASTQSRPGDRHGSARPLAASAPRSAGNWRKRAKAEADAINRAKFPAWATHLHVKPKLPPRRRPRHLECPVCRVRFEVKRRGPIPETCGRRCALALALHNAYLHGREEPSRLLNHDIVANSRRIQRMARHQVIINEMLDRIGVRRRR